MARPSELNLVILLDAGRNDYPQEMPFVSSLISDGFYAKRLYNQGGYCERTCFMTGSPPEVSGNYFAMSLMPPGYKRAYYEPKFNIPPCLRDRLCMSEDQTPDTEKDSFVNLDNGKVIESIWDVMRDKKKWAFEACLALGIRSYDGITTHGSRQTQLLKKLERGVDFAYWQISEIDQKAHYLGSDPVQMKKTLLWADGQIKLVVEKARKWYDHVNLLIFGDHGQTNVTKLIDPPLEYPPYTEGWDYAYLKSSAAIQFWVFNKRVEPQIIKDPRLMDGKFIDSPSKRQGDLIWAANPGVLVNPCHFHTTKDAPNSMHGYQLATPQLETEMGFALLIDWEHKGQTKIVGLTDICPTITRMLKVRDTKQNMGVPIYER